MAGRVSERAHTRKGVAGESPTVWTYIPVPPSPQTVIEMLSGASSAMSLECRRAICFRGGCLWERGSGSGSGWEGTGGVQGPGGRAGRLAAKW